MAIQLRRYQFAEGTLESWLPHWREHVLPLRQEFGFTVLFAFADQVNDQFVWAISYDGSKDDLQAQDRVYHDSPQWEQRNAGRNSAIQHTTIEVVDRLWPV